MMGMRNFRPCGFRRLHGRSYSTRPDCRNDGERERKISCRAIVQENFVSVRFPMLGDTKDSNALILANTFVVARA
jgi:hypothetical protein